MFTRHLPRCTEPPVLSPPGSQRPPFGILRSQMCNYFEDGALAETDQRIASFKQHVPAALDAEGWFRHHNTYADGKPIVA